MVPIYSNYTKLKILHKYYIENTSRFTVNVKESFLSFSMTIFCASLFVKELIYQEILIMLPSQKPLYSDSFFLINEVPSLWLAEAPDGYFSAAGVLIISSRYLTASGEKGSLCGWNKCFKQSLFRLNKTLAMFF